METRWKILIVSAVILLLLIGMGIPLGILFSQNRALKQENELLRGENNVAYNQLTDSLQRAETKTAESTNAIDSFAKQSKMDIEKIRDDLEDIGARVDSVASTKAKTVTIVREYHHSDKVQESETEPVICEEDGRPIDVHGYTKTKETTHIEDSNGMRVASASFEAAKERPWTTKSYGIEYTINNVIGETRDGTTTLHTELLARNPEAQPDQEFRIKGVESRVLQAPEPPPEFDWWDPTLYLALTPGVVVHPNMGFSASLSVAFSVFSYDDWKFLGISAGYDAFQNTFRAGLIPVLYNLGSPLPLIDDLWIFAEVGLDHEAQVSVSLGIGTSL